LLVLAFETLGEEGIFVWSNDGISIVLVAIIGIRGDNSSAPNDYSKGVVGKIPEHDGWRKLLLLRQVQIL